MQAIPDADLGDQLHEAVQHIGGHYEAQELAPEEELSLQGETIPADPNVKNFSYAVVDGDVYFRENSIMRKADLSATATGRIKGMVELRTIVQELIDYQLNDYPEDAIAQKQRELNVAYDRFADQYGLINSRANAQAFSEDSSYYLLCSLENVDENGRLESKADMFTKRTIRPERAVTSVDTPAEALAISIGERDRVELPYMSELLGTPGEYEKIRQELHGVIFKDPMTQGGEENGWVTADEYLSGNVREKLRVAALARKPKDFRELIGILQEAGYEYKDGKQPALRGKGHARFARFRSLGKGYSIEELCEVIAGNAVHKSKFAEKIRTSARSAQVHQRTELSFLIDVRTKMQAGKGAGYARWAKVFNLKQMAKAMMFMEERGIKSYAEIKEKADGISEKCDALLESVKADEARMSEVSVLRKHLINYAKTKDVFAAYKASGYNREFYEAHRDMLALRSAAKKAFDAYKKENGSDKKLPRISELNAEYAMLLERKKSSYAEYRKTKSKMQDWLVAQKIVQEILKEDEQKKEQLHEQEVRQEEENRQSSR